MSRVLRSVRKRKKGRTLGAVDVIRKLSMTLRHQGRSN